jgi:translocation and assembly module TamB
MRRKLTIAAIAIALLLVLVPLAILSWITYTESGLQFALNRLPAKIGRTELKIEGVKGTLAGGLDVALVEIEHPRSHLKFENVRTEVSLLPLLWQSISAKRLDIERALIEVRPRTTPIVKYEPRFLPRLLSINGDRVNVGETTIVAPSGRVQVFRNTSASGVARSKTIRFYDAKTTWNKLELAAIGTLRAADPMQLEGEGRFTLQFEGQPEWRAAATFAGDLTKLPIEGTLDAPFRATFKGAADTLTTGWHWSAAARVIDFDLQTFGGGGALGVVSGDVNVGGDASGFFLRGPLTPAGLRAGAFETEFEGSYAENVVTAKRIALTHRGTGTRVEASGDIGVEENGPRLGLRGAWRDFAWPWTGEPTAFRSSKGEFSLAGLWPYLVEASGDLLVPNLAAMPFSARGRLDKDHFTIEQATVQALGGTARLEGDAWWQAEEAWQLRGRVAQLNPAAIRPGFPGALDFDLAARGAPFGAAGTIDVEIRNLTGRLRGNSARGSGKFRVRGDDWAFDAVRFQAGNTRVQLDGLIGAVPDLRFTIAADNLGLLAEGARGKLDARGELKGSRTAPIVKLVASGSGIDYEGFKIGDLTADVDVDWGGARASKAKVQATGITYGERAINQLELSLDGSTLEHALTLSGRAAKVVFGIGAAGTFADGTWRGTVRDLSITDNADLKLTLDGPVAIVATASSMRVEPLCLKGKTARLCAQGGYDAQRWNARVTANELPISALTAGLTPDVQYEGTLNIAANVGAPASAPWQGEVRAELSQAALRHKLASGRIDVLRLGSGLVAATATPGGIDGELRLDAGERGTINGKVRAERVGNDARRWPIRGELRAATAELGFITLYAPEIDRAAGRFNADLVIDGVATAPQVSGVMRLDGGQLDFYQVNLALRDLAIEARLLSNNLSFTGRGKAGDGKLDTEGDLQWRDGLPYGKVSFKGDKLRVVNVPEARIDASPNLEFRVDGRRIMAVGEVVLPYARIAPAELTGAVLSSSDEIIVGARLPDPSKRFEVASQIKMTLGDDVTVDTAGLSGSLTGSITVRTTADDVSRALGELVVDEGKYTAYGRKLDIQRGRLIFSGGLLGDPAVDIRAVKQFPDVVAGINVRGSLRQPRLTYFSEPALPQSQIVSLILAGGTLESAQASNRQGSPGARNEFLAQGGAILAQQLGQRVGLEDVSIESNLANETSLVLGKYLSPRLYVSYGISLTESINTIKMRYTINDKWTVKTEAGKERSADLVYTIEK